MNLLAILLKRPNILSPVFRLQTPLSERLCEEAAVAYIGKLLPSTVTLPDMNVEKIKYGRLLAFDCQSQKFLSSGDVNYMLLGNAPVIIDMDSGEVFLASTSEPLEDFIKSNFNPQGVDLPGVRIGKLNQRN